MPQNPNNSLGSLGIVDGTVSPSFLLKLNDRLRRIEQALGLVNGDGSATTALTAEQAQKIVDQGALATLNSVDLGTNEVVNKLLDYLSDTSNYAKVSADALAGNLINLAGTGWTNKNLDNLPDGSSYARVQSGALSGNAINLGASSGWVNKNLDNVPNGTTYARVLATALATSGEIDLAAAGWINKNLDNVPNGSTFAKVLAGALAADGAIDLAAGGWVNKSLDNLPDGATWQRVSGVSGNQTQTGSYAAGSISNTYQANGLPEVVVPQGATKSVLASTVPVPAGPDTSIWYTYNLSFSGTFEGSPGTQLYVTINFVVDGNVLASYVYPVGTPSSPSGLAIPITAVDTPWQHPCTAHTFDVQVNNQGGSQVSVVGYLSVLVTKA